MSVPSIERLAQRSPSLVPAIEAVLERGAALRAAARNAFVAPEPPQPARDADTLAARVEFEAAVLAVEGPHLPISEAAIARVTRAIARLRIGRHAFAPRREFRSIEARQALSQSQALFDRAWRRLETEAAALGVRSIPWRLELSSHCDPDAPRPALEISGYELPATPAARRPWGERCILSGTLFAVDRDGDSPTRFRSLEAAQHVLTVDLHAWVVRLRAALDRAPRDSAALDALARSFGFLFEEYVGEACHPTFARLGLLDYPSLAVALNNLLLAWGERPLFGRRGAEGRTALGCADRAALARGEARSGYGWQSYADARRDAFALARSIERLGMPPEIRIGVLIDQNAPEFYLAEFAAVFTRRAMVGLPFGLPDEALAGILERAEVGVVFADAAGVAKLRSPDFAGARSRLSAIVAFGDRSEPLEAPELDLETWLAPDDALADWRSPSGIALSTGTIHDDAHGHRLAGELGVLPDEPDDLFTIVHTSGSTGAPKGALVTRRRWAEEMCVEADVWPYVGASFQPSAIAGDRGAVWRALTNGGRVGFARRGAELFADLRAIRPTLFDVPPVVWNTLYGEYKRAIERADLDPQAAAGVRRRFRESLGGRLAFMATGGAPSDEGVRRAMESIFGIAMSEGYGTTETGFIACNGVLVPGVEVRLVDRPDLGYTHTDSPLPRGELAVRTPRTTGRYLGETAGASAGFTEDGYFLTGDLVELGPGRRVRVLGRSKLAFKLAGAEFVSPEELEREYAKCDAIDFVLIAAAPGGARVVAVVVPRSDEIDEAGLLAALRGVADRAGLRSHERPAGVVIASRIGGEPPWSVENGLLTPSLKLNRRALEERYREAIAGASRGVDAGAESVPATAGDDAVAARLLDLVAVLLRRPRAELELSRSFLELGGDSLATLELAMRLEEVFGGKQRLDGLWNDAPESIAALPLAELATRLAPSSSDMRPHRHSAPAKPVAEEAEPAARTSLAASQAPAGDAVDGLALANGDALDRPEVDAALPQATSRHVLLTGATGFLGVHLLDHLHRTLPAEAQIFTVVRAKDDRAAAERVRAALAAAGLTPIAIAGGAAESGARVVALAGRLESPQFGLAPEVWAMLAREVGLIHHVAASVTGASGYVELRSANVLGTRRALELATTTTLKAFHLVSSLNVSLLVAGPGNGIALETTPLPRHLSATQYRVNTGYAITKWASERLVEETALASGGRLRASISRPALLAWSRSTGFANDHDWLTRFLVSCLSTRSIPGPPEAGVPRWIPETETSARGLDLVPVDFAAEAIERLGELARSGAGPTGETPAPVFHVSNLASGERGLLNMPRLLDLLLLAEMESADASYRARPPLEIVTPAEWRSRVEETGAAALPILGQLKQSIPSLPRTPTANFRAAVGEALSDPGIDVATLAAFVRANGGSALARAR